MAVYLGFDIGGTSIKYGLIDEQAIILQKGSINTPKDADEIFDSITEIVKEFNHDQLISGIGISCPGIVKADGYLVTGGAIQSLYGKNFKKEIEARTGIKTKVENDANAAAIAEKWVGNAINCHNYLCIVLGTGFGGGIIINDDIYRGAHGMAGEFGYMMTKELDWSQKLEEKSLNQNAAVVAGLIRKYNLAMDIHDELDYVKDPREIMRFAKAGNLVAKRIMDHFYEDLAVGLVNLIGAFDPEVVIIGGGISENTEFIKNLQQTINKVEVAHDSIHELMGKTVGQVIPAKLRNDAGMIGAVYNIKKDLEK